MAIRKWLLCATVAVLMLLTVSLPLFAQGGSTGAISGVVTDKTGAVVPGATVRIIDRATGQVAREVVTESNGSYSATLLRPGTYRVEVSMTGFKNFVAEQTAVRVTETTTLNPTLEVGAIAGEEITVEAAAPVVNTASPATGQTITGATAQQLPLPTANFLQLLALSTGASTDLSDTAALGRGQVSIEVNGQRPVNNNYQLEGVNVNDFNLPQFDNVPLPNPSTIQEFKTQTSLYDASQGRNGGGNIQVLLRSGSTDWHGNLYEYFRNNVLNASDWFLNAQGQPRPILKQNQLGGSLGGPIPNTGSFFFVNYQASRARSGIASGTNINTTIPVLPVDRSPASLAAWFSQPQFQLNPGNPVTLTAADLDPVAVAILNLRGTQFGSGPGGFLIPSVPPTAPGAPSGRLNLSSVGRAQDDQFTITWDKPIGASDKLSARWFFSNSQSFRPFGTAGSLKFPQNAPNKNRFITVIHSHTFGPKTVNEFRFGYNRFSFKIIPTEPVGLASVGATRPNQIDFPAIFQVGVTGGPGQFTIFPGVNDDRGGNFNTFYYMDTISHTVRTHTFRAGAEASRYQLNRFNRFATRGSVSFTNRGGFSGIQNFARGFFTSTQGGAGFFDFFFRNTDVALFVQDDWKLTPRLTLNLGVRWEMLGISHEKRNFLTNLSDSTGRTRERFIFPEELTLKNLGTPGVPDCTANRCFDKRNVGPRVGLAWDVFGNQRMVVRSGYGIYYQRTSNQPLLQSTGGGVFSQAVSSSATAPQSLNNPFPSLLPQSLFPLNPVIPDIVGFNAMTGAPIFSGTPQGFLFFFDRDIRAPYTQQWNLTIQTALPWSGWSAEIGYVGTKGNRLLFTRAFNQPVLATQANPLVVPTTSGPVAITSSTESNADARVPAGFIGIQAAGWLGQNNQGASSYHSLQATILHQFANGLYFQGAYTFSKSIDNTSGSLSVDELNGLGLFNNQLDVRSNRGLSDFDRTHRFVASFNYDLPFFRQQGGLTGKLLGGWGLNGVVTYQSGTPFTIFDGGGGSLFAVDICCIATASFAPGQTRENAIKSGRVQDRLTEFFNRSAFTTAPCANDQGQPVPCNSPAKAGTLFGNSGRNILRGPYQQNWDLAFIKRIPINEKHNLEFRSEFFNIWNHPVFNNPRAQGIFAVNQVGTGQNVDISSRDISIVSTAVRPRIIQFALRYNF